MLHISANDHRYRDFMGRHCMYMRQEYARVVPAEAIGAATWLAHLIRLVLSELYHLRL